jgi:hypothetical protein
VLGEIEIERAWHAGSPLLLFHDVIGWLRGGCWGAVVLDLDRLGEMLEGVRVIRCSRRLAPVVHRACQAHPRPKIEIPIATSVEAKRAA